MLLKTKLFKPRLTPDHVARERLFRKLEQNKDLPLILVSAPAGYGKSTLLAGWIETSTVRSAWLSLSSDDNLLTRFLRYFITAIQTELKEFGKNVLHLLEASEQPPEDVLYIELINDLAGLEDEIYLVIDDLHYITNQVIHEFFQELLNHPVNNFHLILITRSDPPLPLFSLRSKRLVFDIRARDLQFDENEVGLFIKNATGITPTKESSNTIQKITEGWISGVRMFVLSIDENENIEQQVHGFGIHDRLQIQSLLKSVINKLSPDIQKCLLTTSVLDKFCDELCDYVCNENNDSYLSLGTAFIQVMEKANLFITPLDKNRKWFRYHHLFAELIEVELRNNCDEAAIMSIHQKAGKWFERNGMYEEAIHHLIKAEDYQSAENIFAFFHKTMLNNAEWQRLEQLLRLFPDELVQSSGMLLLSQNWVHMYHSNFVELFGNVSKIEALIDKMNTDKATQKSLLAVLKSMAAYKSYYELDPKSSIKHAQYSIDNLKEESKFTRGLAWIFFGASSQMLGEGRIALNKISKEILKDPDGAQNGYMIVATNYIVFFEVNLRELIFWAKQLHDFGKRTGNLEASVNSAYFHGVGLYLSNKIEQAYRELSQVYDYRYHTIGNVRMAYLFTYALVCFEKGEKKLAFEIIEQVYQGAWSSGNEYQKQSAEMLKAELFFRMRKLKEAAEIMNKLVNMPARAFAYLYFPQVTVIKVLIYQETEISQKQAAKMLKAMLNMFTPLHNCKLIKELKALKALLVADIGKHDDALLLLKESFETGGNESNIRTYVDLGPKMLELLKSYNLEFGKSEYTSQLMNSFPGGNHTHLHNLLSERELEIVQLFSEKLMNKEIGDKLFIAEKTVKTHSTNIFKKLEVKNRREAVAKARELGLIS